MELAEQNRLAEAEEWFARADERGHAAAAVNLGVLLEKRGDTARAAAAYRRADERGDADGSFELAMLLAHRNRLTEAEEALARADERGHRTPRTTSACFSKTAATLAALRRHIGGPTTAAIPAAPPTRRTARAPR